MQQQYRAYQQQMPPQVPHRSPHATTQRRGGYGPVMTGGQPAMQPAHVQNQHNMQQQQALQAAEATKRLKTRKPTDKTLPDGVENCIVDPEVARRYKELRDVERRIDTTMTRKRLDVVDSANRNAKLYRTLRVWITNTVEDQIWQGSGDLNVDAFDFSPNMEASYRVKIEGRLLDEDDDADADSPKDSNVQDGDKMDEDAPESDKKAGSSSSKPRFSHFFKEINVEFDKQRYRNGADQAIEWKRPEPGARAQPGANQVADFDEFTFKRNGDENFNITINLHRFEVPERYSLSPELSEIVDMKEGTQHEVVMGLWEYIRMNGLQEDEEKRNFRCDELLKRVIGPTDVAHIPMLNEYVKRHLGPQAPISLPYTIRVDEDFHKDPQPTIYDVQVLIDDPMRATLQSLVVNPQYASMLKDVTDLDDQLGRLVQAVAVSHAKHSFFNSLSEDPANFVRNWLSSQKRDLDVIFGETARSGAAVAGDEWRKGGKDSIWATSNARESVNVLLSKQR